jgi:hypothetical protein
MGLSIFQENRMISTLGYTFPSRSELQEFAARRPDHTWPNLQPYAFIMPGALSEKMCADILFDAAELEPYKFGSCGATTREFDRPLPGSLRHISKALKEANEMYWNFLLDWNSSTAWLQTYGPGDDYHQHTDAAPGESRKITAVAFLSDNSHYVGGSLILKGLHDSLVLRPPKGTIAIFPASLWHEVTEIQQGTRYTINLGVWGPPFR